jgi:hypothetical protein
MLATFKMVAAIATRSVHMIQRQMRSFVRAKLVSPVSHRVQALPVLVSASAGSTVPMTTTVDSCRVQNGGCDMNAICSHEPATNAVVCTCKTGYTNTAVSPSLSCTGE